ncbi:hypothetical protein BWQ96_01119 [Gracilariopsis chorda]|uniref:ER membrane protein complex subunit 7 beta-sandwich domain-containing protein n=1 Tax=Gracilariopsis chorda TaxID=448386 RepID=A0A2V3J3G2_9FLOR|nr:hypothetical protein BWQ96_01119 [Gracilariopsis chorda]|eukprot:PXF48981.1 hypothetical protein BWQ96_01119 [Gracilariopsis chorda]
MALLVARKILVTSLLYLWLFSPVHSLTINGTLATPCDDPVSALQVAAYGRDGKLASSAAITANATFRLFLQVSERTHYILYLLGSIENHYDPLIVDVEPHQVLLAHVRKSPLQLPPKASNQEDVTTVVHFVPGNPTRFSRKRMNKRWSWRNLWAYRMHALLLTGAVFIVWFPKIIRDLPSDVRAELLGEHQEEPLDPNAVFKALSGLQEDNIENSITTTRG